MMKHNLGKILFFLLFAINVWGAQVSIKLSSLAIYEGDSVTFTLNATGNNVEFPEITDIDGYVINGTSMSSSTTIINGNYSKTISKSYRFTPKHDVTIPSFTIKIDGQEFKTQSKKVSVLKPQASKNGDPFIVEVQVDKTKLKVGESTQLHVFFKQRVDASALKVNLEDPKLENFWIKKIDNQKQYTKGNYVITQYNYLIFAQKAGKFTLKPLEAEIGHLNQRMASMGGFFNDPFFNQMTGQLDWQKIYSNSIDIEVEDLPNGIELYGDFQLSIHTNKTTVFANKPLNLTIEVKGSGNVEDIKPFEINLPDAIVYPDKPQIKSHLINGEYQGVFTQKIAIISDENYTIPSLSLSYFDKNTKSIKTITSKPIFITVKGQSKKAQMAPVVQTLHQNNQTSTSQKVKKEVIIKQDTKQNYLYLLMGIILGSGVTFLLLELKNRPQKQEESDMVKRIKKIKDDKELFHLLLPYANDHQDISDILKLLEENIYKNANHKIDKQKLYDIFL